uniref:Uncharacterized protein n=1 Tax=Oryza sativa subsp. japonica TaxID=39947 RepID=Q67VH8_ORYSJ|nr:hypothetical protein [Oryza sativa Japonica Group]
MATHGWKVAGIRAVGLATGFEQCGFFGGDMGSLPSSEKGRAEKEQGGQRCGEIWSGECCVELPSRCAIWFQFGSLFPDSIIHVPCESWMCYLAFIHVPVSTA